ncbi:hypothetical protein V5O48_013572 [Marasmius crinis-equi]|uniref:Uncharacterized protein n=1 Tax=Marasmius crinis-equi TaxID=585013 RepID=A0ABR3EZU0_9AGAR
MRKLANSLQIQGNPQDRCEEPQTELQDYEESQTQEESQSYEESQTQEESQQEIFMSFKSKRESVGGDLDGDTTLAVDVGDVGNGANNLALNLSMYLPRPSELISKSLYSSFLLPYNSVTERDCLDLIRKATNQGWWEGRDSMRAQMDEKTKECDSVRESLRRAWRERDAAEDEVTRLTTEVRKWEEYARNIARQLFQAANS